MMGRKKKVIINKEGDKALEKLEKERAETLKAAEKEYKAKRKTLTGAAAEKSRLAKLKFWGKTKTDQVDDPKFWALVNIESLKEFVKYGANKVMDQIRIRTHANIISREEIQKLKEEKKGVDAKTILYTLMLAAIVGSVAFVLISQFLNYKVVQDDNIALNKKYGTQAGQLATCQTELAGYKGPAPATQEVKPGEVDNTLEG